MPVFTPLSTEQTRMISVKIANDVAQQTRLSFVVFSDSKMFVQTGNASVVGGKL